MGKTRTRLLLAIALVAALGVAGVTVYVNVGHSRSEAANADSPEIEGPDGEAGEDAAVDPNATGSGPVAFTVPGHSVFIDTRTLRSAPPTKRAPARESELADRATHTGLDVGVQNTVGTLAAPAPIVNALGLDFANWGAGHPPDTNGVVGPNHFVQSVNTSIGIFDKSTGARISAFTFDDFFVNSGTAECDSTNGGDPTVVYDVPSGKWVIADFGFRDLRRGPYFECIAVSSGSDPVASTWTFYSVPAGDNNFPDYPKFGSGPDAIFFTTNNFRRASTYVNAGVYAIRRTTLGSSTLQVQHVTTSSSFFSLLPANVVDAAPASGPEIITSIWNGRLSLWRFQPDWTNTANTTFVNTANIAVSYTSFGQISTPGEAVDSLSPRAMSKSQFRNGSVWMTHTVTAGSVAGVRWYEVTNLSGTPTIRQSGTYSPTTNVSRFMPSLAVDKQGNMAVGYNVASSTLNPAIRYAGRLTTDALGTLGQSETSLIEGTGAPSSGNFNRWGDYSEMSVDPVDGCTFWFTGEYYAVTGADWQTRIGSFKFPGCV